MQNVYQNRTKNNIKNFTKIASYVLLSNHTKSEQLYGWIFVQQ